MMNDELKHSAFIVANHRSFCRTVNIGFKGGRDPGLRSLRSLTRGYYLSSRFIGTH
jgi:hypothetical protein